MRLWLLAASTFTATAWSGDTLSLVPFTGNSTLDSRPQANGSLALNGSASAETPTTLPVSLTRRSHKRHGNGTNPGHSSEEALSPYLRWLWWVVVLYFFWAQAWTCDEYFVPTIEVISDRCEIPDDIAGATIMALGCNGPELFINSVAMVNKSDLGVGAVLGGSVFNLLVLSGCALIATPAMYMPLRISKFSFSRDVLFYAASIGLIYWVLYDGNVNIVNAIVLLAGGLVYSTVVGFSSTLRSWITPASPHDRNSPSECLSSWQQQHLASSGKGFPSVDPCPADQAEVGSSPEDGCFLGVRVQMGNRMQDRSRHWETRLVRIGRDGLIVSTDVRDTGSMRFGRTARGIVFTHGADQQGYWCHGGLVNAPTLNMEQSAVQCTANAGSAVHPTGHVTGMTVSFNTATASGADLPRANSDPQLFQRQVSVSSLPSELISFNDVVRCVAPLNPAHTHFEVQVLQRKNMLGKVIAIELDAKSVEMRDRWIMAIKLGMHTLTRQISDASVASIADTQITMGPSAPTKMPALMELVDWFRFPVKFLLRLTIPNVKEDRCRRCVVMSFLMSMFWLALFSFSVVQVCDIISYEFNISVTTLGFTVAAIGTSFPNVISCIAVSRQGKTAMAIANALGANIQNVFIALALPWFCKAMTVGTFDVGSDTGALTAAVISMVVTLVMLIIVVLIARCTMPKWAGVVFLCVYVVYLVWSMGEEFSSCVTWPVCH